MKKIIIQEYIESQQSLHLYEEIRKALFDVLGGLSDEQFYYVQGNLIIMAFHQGVVGQVMHFGPRQEKFAVMQLYMPDNMPEDVLRYVLAHELGHVMQRRNWIEPDGMTLEDDATRFAESIGFPKTQKIKKWLDDFDSGAKF